MTATTKQCPRCAEMVLIDATACRFCGYDPAEVDRLHRAEAVTSDRWVTFLLLFAITPAVVAIAWFVVLR